MSLVVLSGKGQRMAGCFHRQWWIWMSTLLEPMPVAAEVYWPALLFLSAFID